MVSSTPLIFMEEGRNLNQVPEGKQVGLKIKHDLNGMDGGWCRW